ncbi:hypothetical protein [Mycoplasmopsis columbinasalis]|uniref:Uncharacterized protein n=1 Tax=Mycoplasmopsis columbinasalis TaxID=114880 RepID=A0A449BAY3_9BACT|nr:hypothetical protein [Mycoplasmopsis columbinasalis]VEU78357.1 Uncharacterised protein [Mycoplasmopsis columbinasalis]
MKLYGYLLSANQSESVNQIFTQLNSNVKASAVAKRLKEIYNYSKQRIAEYDWSSVEPDTYVNRAFPMTLWSFKDNMENNPNLIALNSLQNVGNTKEILITNSQNGTDYTRRLNSNDLFALLPFVGSQLATANQAKSTGILTTALLPQFQDQSQPWSSTNRASGLPIYISIVNRGVNGENTANADAYDLNAYTPRYIPNGKTVDVKFDLHYYINPNLANNTKAFLENNAMAQHIYQAPVSFYLQDLKVSARPDALSIKAENLREADKSKNIILDVANSGYETNAMFERLKTIFENKNAELTRSNLRFFTELVDKNGTNTRTNDLNDEEKFALGTKAGHLATGDLTGASRGLTLNEILKTTSANDFNINLNFDDSIPLWVAGAPWLKFTHDKDNDWLSSYEELNKFKQMEVPTSFDENFDPTNTANWKKVVYWKPGDASVTRDSHGRVTDYFFNINVFVPVVDYSLYQSAADAKNFFDRSFSGLNTMLPSFLMHFNLVIRPTYTALYKEISADGTQNDFMGFNNQNLRVLALKRSYVSKDANPDADNYINNLDHLSTIDPYYQGPSIDIPSWIYYANTIGLGYKDTKLFDQALKPYFYANRYLTRAGLFRYDGYGKYDAHMQGYSSDNPYAPFGSATGDVPIQYIDNTGATVSGTVRGAQKGLTLLDMARQTGLNNYDRSYRIVDTLLDENNFTEDIFGPIDRYVPADSVYQGSVFWGAVLGNKTEIPSDRYNVFGDNYGTVNFTNQITSAASSLSGRNIDRSGSVDGISRVTYVGITDNLSIKHQNNPGSTLLYDLNHAPANSTLDNIFRPKNGESQIRYLAPDSLGFYQLMSQYLKDGVAVNINDVVKTVHLKEDNGNIPVNERFLVAMTESTANSFRKSGANWLSSGGPGTPNFVRLTHAGVVNFIIANRAGSQSDFESFKNPRTKDGRTWFEAIGYTNKTLSDAIKHLFGITDAGELSEGTIKTLRNALIKAYLQAMFDWSMSIAARVDKHTGANQYDPVYAFNLVDRRYNTMTFLPSVYSDWYKWGGWINNPNRRNEFGDGPVTYETNTLLNFKLTPRNYNSTFRDTLPRTVQNLQGTEGYGHSRDSWFNNVNSILNASFGQYIVPASEGTHVNLFNPFALGSSEFAKGLKAFDVTIKLNDIDTAGNYFGDNNS